MTTIDSTLRTLPLRLLPMLEPQATMEEAMALMETEPLRALVLIGDGQYMGLLTEETAKDLLPADVPIGDLVIGPYVHPSAVVLAPETAIAEAFSVMRRRRMRLAPVVENVKFLGVLTFDDIERGIVGQE